ncbi:MAG: site-2 protease family protein [Clostridia bacterium]|nr:site-2 protease family protein [Clostridia bacterium]MBQ9997453.1 site-2 protease family protein [Clostridia bacterium]
MLNILIAILVFCLIITAHEFGHFISAKICGVTVHEFSIGMGPAFFKKQGKETLFSLRAIPFGGYCKMEGEDEESESEGSFSSKSRPKKLLILASGAIMNIITGFLLFVIIMFQTKAVVVPVVDTVLENYPAYNVLMSGDEITKVNGKRVYTSTNLNTEIARNGEQPVELTLKRNGETKVVTITPKNEDGRVLLGFMSGVKELNFGNRLFYAYRNTVDFSKMVITSLGDLITGKVGLNNLSGPAGIVSEIGNAADSAKEEGSYIPLLVLVAFITINLGVFNLLPIPALDGGRIFFVLVSAVIRKDIPPEKEGIVHFIGLVLLFGLMIYATGNDLIRIFRS